MITNKTGKSILLSILAVVIIILLVLPILLPSKSNTSVLDLDRLDEISKRLADIWDEKVEVQANIDWLQMVLSELELEEQTLNDEATAIFYSVINPQKEHIEMFPDWHIISEEEIAEWQPWDLTEDWDHQEMPDIDSSISDSHERFKAMAEAYWLDASMIWNVENHYWIREGVVLCITVAETSGWNRWAWWKNIWSVGSNDRWDRPTFALMESGLEAIWKTLTNQYLWSKKTLGCLSNAWSCVEPGDNWKRYATSEHSWQANMVACLSEIYWPVNASNFNIRR